MLRVGLTGGIGCGKSTVAAMLRELGFTVIAADPLAHKLLESGQAAAVEVIREFGPQILDAEGGIDRGKLGEIVFADPEKLATLNRIVHPRIIEGIERRLAEMVQRGEPKVAVVEAALLVESGFHKQLERLIVAWCRPAQQRERLLARGFSPQQAERRIAAQLPLEEKRRLADDEVDCSGSLEVTRKQVERLAAKLKKLAA